MTKFTEPFTIRLTQQTRQRLSVAAQSMAVPPSVVARQCIALILDPENATQESIKMVRQAAKGEANV